VRIEKVLLRYCVTKYFSLTLTKWFALQEYVRGIKVSINKLSPTAWECKYHMVWIPKKRRKVIYGKLRKDIGIIISEVIRVQRYRNKISK